MPKHESFEYDTVEAFLADAAKGAAGEGRDWSEARSSVKGTREFTGTSGIGEALTLARAGWPAGRAKMVQGVAAVAAAPSFSRAAARMLDVAGAYPIAALAAAGVPACMVTPVPVEESSRPIIRLGVSGSYSSFYTADEVMHFGAALLGLIDAIEAADMRVELNILFPSTSSRDMGTMSLGVRLKEAQDSLDLDRCAFFLAHPSTLRRLVFGVIEYRSSSRRWSPGYGSPRLPDARDGDGLVFLAGVQQLKAGSPALKSPIAAFDALLPAALIGLADRYADLPPLQFERDRDAA